MLVDPIMSIILPTFKLFSSNITRFAFVRCMTTASQIAAIDFEELRVALEKKSLVYIDCRNRNEMAKDGKIVGTTFNIPLPEVVDAFTNASEEDFKEKYGSPKPDKITDQVVVGCQVGKRAGIFAEYLHQIGFTKVRVYVGSYKEWVEKQGPISAA